MQSANGNSITFTNGVEATLIQINNVPVGKYLVIGSFEMQNTADGSLNCAVVTTAGQGYAMMSGGATMVNGKWSDHIVMTLVNQTAVGSLVLKATPYASGTIKTQWQRILAIRLS